MAQVIAGEKIAKPIFQSAVKKSLQERVNDLIPVMEIRRMVDLEDRQAICDLRRRGFEERYGNVSENWDAFATNPQDIEPNSRTFGIFLRGKLCSTIKIYIISPECPHSPSMEFFPEAVGALLDEGRVVVDPSRMVSDPQASEDFPELPFLSLKLCIMACHHYAAEDCLSLVRRDHAPFYKRIFRAKTIGDAVEHKTFPDKFMLLNSSVDGERPGFYERYPFWRSSHLERRQLFGPAEEMPGIVERNKRIAASEAA